MFLLLLFLKKKSSRFEAKNLITIKEIIELRMTSEESIGLRILHSSSFN